MKTAKFSILAGLVAFSVIASSTISALGQTFSRPDLINWINGPAKANVGLNAEIEIPPGFSFVSGQDAVTVLKMMNNPAPASLAGILAPTSRKYLIIFEYNQAGYVKNAYRQKINAAAVLKHLGSSNLSASINSVEWQIEPKYDHEQNLLEWAILAKTDSSKTVNHVVRLLGREGMIDAIAVQSAGSSDPVPLKQLVSGISFKPGYSYADYQEGDKVSERNLAELIAGVSSPELQTTSSDSLAYAIAGGILVLLGAGVLVVRRKKSVKAPAVVKAVAPASAPALHLNGNGHSNGNGNGNGHSHSNGHSNGNGNGHSNSNGLLPKPIQTSKVSNRVNGKANGNQKRRRVFDYNRYYTDLMSQVSDRAEGSSPSGRHQAAHSSRAKSSVTQQPVIELSPNSVTANLNLIESQKRLIEEQQRLIREQTKLIEEKTRLIQEKNQVLDKQSELFGSNVF